jgi:hypothetical protein
MESKFATGFSITLPKELPDLVLLTFEQGQYREEIWMPKNLFEEIIGVYPVIQKIKQHSGNRRS